MVENEWKMVRNTGFEPAFSGSRVFVPKVNVRLSTESSTLFALPTAWLM
jgi:hypothetical protein